MGVEYYCDIDEKMSQFYVFNIAKQCIKPIHINVLNPSKLSGTKVLVEKGQNMIASKNHFLNRYTETPGFFINHTNTLKIIYLKLHI